MVMLPGQWRLEPVAQSFIERLDRAGVAPVHTLPPHEARAKLAELQSGPIGRPKADIENLTFPREAGGCVRARIVRPPAAGKRSRHSCTSMVAAGSRATCRPMTG